MHQRMPKNAQSTHSSARSLQLRHLVPVSAIAVMALMSSCASSPASNPDPVTWDPVISDTSASDSTNSDSTNLDSTSSVTFALDWTPNTNHIGVYVAHERGYFAEAGLDVEILPYQDMPVPDVIDAGIAQFGIADQTAVQVSRTAGLDIVSVFQVTQTETGVVVYLGDREDINRPADLDGMVFGGFDAPIYSEIARAVIRGDGGQGEFTEIELNTGTYDALSSEEVDFTLSIATWENILLQMQGNPYGTFRYQDYGMPDVQTIGIISSDEFLAQNPDVSRAFIQAVQRGYEYAVENPEQAAQILVEANPEHLADLAELTRASAVMLAEDGYLQREGFAVGSVNPKLWDEYGQFLHDHGFLLDPHGEELTEVPDWSTYYSEGLLAQ